MAGVLTKFFRTPRIKNPTLGILDLSSGTASDIVQNDRTQLGPLFGTVLESTDLPPHCDVLFIYCHIADTGAISGSTLSLREMIRDSAAKIVVVALPNSGAAYIAAAQPRSYGKANLVMTLDRKNSSFAQFFVRLFTSMKRGESMPVAWVKLAPQIPRSEHPDCPEAIFACEAGQLAFG